ncbi:uncharacterized protein BDV17DRAFT_73536 [Aspergillus undulatus]|uniref:uncharacterized protein n=1 Tax=Aspergillus undulatus TaxID=1810928 RepID=UPI003CCDE17D
MPIAVCSKGKPASRRVWTGLEPAGLYHWSTIAASGKQTRPFSLRSAENLEIAPFILKSCLSVGDGIVSRSILSCLLLLPSLLIRFIIVVRLCRSFFLFLPLLLSLSLPFLTRSRPFLTLTSDSEPPVHPSATLAA